MLKQKKHNLDGIVDGGKIQDRGNNIRLYIEYLYEFTCSIAEIINKEYKPHTFLPEYIV